MRAMSGPCARPRGRVPVAALALLAALAGASAAQARQASAANGERLARRDCGGCHAVRGTVSPFPDAPPFARLHKRYPPGGLDRLLGEGMLYPERPPEEGAVRTHPRMPQAKLDDDQRADLKAFLESLDPRRRRPPHNTALR